MEVASMAKKNNMGMCNGIKLRGIVTYKAYDKDHNLVDTKTTHNNIVLGIREPIIELLSGYQALLYPEKLANLHFIRKIRLGNNPQAPTALDNKLYGEIPGSENMCISEPQINTSGPNVTFAFMYNPTSSIDGKIIKEMGLYACKQDGTGDVLVARTVVGDETSGWTKLNGLYFEIYWTIGYQGEITAE